MVVNRCYDLHYHMLNTSRQTSLANQKPVFLIIVSHGIMVGNMAKAYTCLHEFDRQSVHEIHMFKGRKPDEFVSWMQEIKEGCMSDYCSVTSAKYLTNKDGEQDKIEVKLKRS